MNISELKQIEGFPNYYITKEGKVFHVKEINPCDTLYGYDEVALKEHVAMHNGKKVTIDGIEYESLRKAQKSLGINRARITTAIEKYKTNILNSNMIRR